MSLELCLNLNKRAGAGLASVFLGVLHHSRWNCTDSKVKDADKNLSYVWQRFIALLEDQDISPGSVKRDPKIRHLNLMLSFARRRADLLFALNRDDVTALAQSGTPPREYHDQRLSIASRRLSFSFASEDNSVSCPSPGDGAEARGQPAGSGPASLQDLLRVIQGWTSSNQITPGVSRHAERLVIQLIDASRQEPDPDHVQSASRCVTPTLEGLANVVQPNKPIMSKLRPRDIEKTLRFQRKLAEAASIGIVEAGDWECSACLHLNERRNRTCLPCGRAAGTVGNRRVTSQDVAVLYPGPEPPTRRLMPRQNNLAENLDSSEAFTQLDVQNSDMVAPGNRNVLNYVSSSSQYISRKFQPLVGGTNYPRSGDLRQPLSSDAPAAHQVAMGERDISSGEASKSPRTSYDEEDYAIRRIRATVTVTGKQGGRQNREIIHQPGRMGNAHDGDGDSEGIQEEAEEFDGHIGAIDVNQPEAKEQYNEFYTNPPMAKITSRSGTSATSGIQRRRRKS